jgi:quinol monooxygenase YgiN
MIRINAFFTLKEGVSLPEVRAISDELVAKSRLDEGNKAYDLFQSTTNPRVMMFCESWESQAALDKHMATPHFQSAVPQLEKLMDGGLKLESFERK